MILIKINPFLGKFPHAMFSDSSSTENEIRFIQQDPLRFVLLHIFYLVSSYMFISILSNIYSLVF